MHGLPEHNTSRDQPLGTQMALPLAVLAVLLDVSKTNGKKGKTYGRNWQNIEALVTSTAIARHVLGALQFC